MMNWPSIPIKEFGCVVTGRTPPSAEPLCFGNSTPFLTPTDMTFDQRSVVPERGISRLGAERFARTMVPSQAISVVCIGATIGKICMTSVPTLTNQQINTIICDPEKANPKFVYYSMRLHRDELTAKAAGAATPIINKSTFEEIEVALPDLEIQHWIANIISNYDDLIEVNTRRITILEEMTCRLFDEWFVKYQFPDHGAATFVETDEGRIPQGWTKTDVRTLIERKKAGLTATCVLPATYCFPS